MAVRFAVVAMMLLTVAPSAQAEDRSVLVNCKAMVDRAAKQANAASEAELARCRQVIREWELRDARMTVDEHGRPLR